MSELEDRILYPVPTGIEAFKAELAAFKTGKGSVQFPLDRRLPAELIRRIVAFRVRECAGGDAPQGIPDGSRPSRISP